MIGPLGRFGADAVLLNFGRTEKMWAVCGGKTNILPTSFQHTIHKEPIFSPTPHLLGGVNVERLLIDTETVNF